jgi:queuine tRNA-ribosyltransferase
MKAPPRRGFYFDIIMFKYEPNKLIKSVKFKINKKIPNQLGRTGTIFTPHGEIKTPAYVTVGTKATVKALKPEDVKRAGAQVVLANTYHLYLQPGDEIVKKAGGLHDFMNWQGPTMTDSGGFQVFSLGAAFGKNITKITAETDPEKMLQAEAESGRHQRGEINEHFKPAKVYEDKVVFRSHIDGSIHEFTPEKSIEIQNNLGADMVFAFDECTSPNESVHYQRESLDRTHRWAKKSLKFHIENSPNTDYFKKNGERQALFGIIQGGRHEDLRKRSAEELAKMEYEGKGFDGFGIGGSFEKADMSKAVAWVNEILPEDKPRHLLGIGEPEDLFMAVEGGCDLFDCVAATRIARNGQMYTETGKINIRNEKFKEDFTPVDENCGCDTCKNYTKAYLHHLFKADEMLAATLAAEHNLYFIIHLVDQMREKIESGEFEEFKDKWLNKYINE